MKRTGPVNIHTRLLISSLRKQARKEKAAIWRRVAECLMKPTRKRIEMNLSKINRLTEDEDVIVVPGKVLAAGNLEHKVTIAALSFSKKAKEKISERGEAISIIELLDLNPRGEGVRILA